MKRFIIYTITAVIMLTSCNDNRQGLLEQTNRLRQTVEDSI